MSGKETTNRGARADSKQKSPPLASEDVGAYAQQNNGSAVLSQRAKLEPRLLPPHGVLHLQRSIGNRAVAGMLAGARQSSNATLIQRGELYDAAARQAPQSMGGEGLPQGQLEAAIREVLVEIVAGGAFKNVMDMPVDAAAIGHMTFNWHGDYAFSLGGGDEGLDLVLSVPNTFIVTHDIVKGTLQMTLMHELSHAARTSGNEQVSELFELAEGLVLSVNWGEEVAKEPESAGKEEDWQEEVRADLKSVVLFHRKFGRFQNEAELKAYQDELGGNRTVAHPPPAFRVEQMKNFIQSAGPMVHH